MDVYHLIKHTILCQLLSIRANGLYQQLPFLIRSSSSSSSSSLCSLSSPLSSSLHQNHPQDHHYTNRILIDYLEQVLPSLCLSGRKNDERMILISLYLFYSYSVDDILHVDIRHRDQFWSSVHSLIHSLLSSPIISSLPFQSSLSPSSSSSSPVTVTMTDLMYILHGRSDDFVFATLFVLGYTGILRTIDFDLLKLKLEFSQSIQWQLDEPNVQFHYPALNYVNETAVRNRI